MQQDIYEKKMKMDKFDKKGEYNNSITTEKFSKNVNEFTFLKVSYNGKIFNIERTSDWKINVTSLAKFFNKRWRDWKKRNIDVIQTFEKLEGKPLIWEVGPKNKVQTYVSIILALRILSDYDKIFSWHIITEYQRSLQKEKDMVLLELQKAYQTIQLSDAKIAKLENKPINVDLVGGKCLLYAYTRICVTIRLNLVPVFVTKMAKDPSLIELQFLI